MCAELNVLQTTMYEDQRISRETVLCNSTYSTFSPFQDPVTLFYEKITHYLKSLTPWRWRLYFTLKHSSITFILHHIQDDQNINSSKETMTY